MALPPVSAYEISIHLPRVGQDPAAQAMMSARLIFQSTCPVWGRTLRYAGDELMVVLISIHLPRVGQDQPSVQIAGHLAHFNPPAPCGAGQGGTTIATKTSNDFNPPAPCGAGQRLCIRHGLRYDFNPPAPCGAGQHKFTKNSLVIYATQTNRSVCVQSWQNSICTVLP